MLKKAIGFKQVRLLDFLHLIREPQLGDGEHRRVRGEPFLLAAQPEATVVFPAVLMTQPAVLQPF